MSGPSAKYRYCVQSPVVSRSRFSLEKRVAAGATIYRIEVPRSSFSSLVLRIFKELQDVCADGGLRLASADVKPSNANLHRKCSRRLLLVKMVCAVPGEAPLRLYPNEPEAQGIEDMGLGDDRCEEQELSDAMEGSHGRGRRVRNKAIITTTVLALINYFARSGRNEFQIS
jgi:hypothetical protein